MRKNKIVILVFGAILLITSCHFYVQHKKKLFHKGVFVSGNIEVTEINVSFQTQGKIQMLCTDEGKMVRKGEMLAQLDKEELLKIVAQTKASLKEAEYNYTRLRDDFVRAQNLLAAGAISVQKRDTDQANMEMAKAKLDSLKASLALSQTRLNYSNLYSPMDGFVLVKSAEAGEVVQMGTVIFTVADLRNAWLTGYIGEKDLGRVKLNQEAEIKIDTYPDKIYKGRVSFISQEAEFTPKHIQTKEERTKLVYRIKIMVDNTDLELKSGMPVEATILVE